MGKKQQLHDNMPVLRLVMDNNNEGHQADRLQAKTRFGEATNQPYNILKQGALLKRGDVLPIYRDQTLELSTNRLTWAADGKQRGCFSLLEFGPHRSIINGPAVAIPYEGN